MDNFSHNNLLTINQVCSKINRSRVTLWKWVSIGTFPKPLKIGNRTLGWKEEVLNEWLDTLALSK